MQPALHVADKLPQWLHADAKDAVRDTREALTRAKGNRRGACLLNQTAGIAQWRRGGLPGPGVRGLRDLPRRARCELDPPSQGEPGESVWAEVRVRTNATQRLRFRAKPLPGRHVADARSPNRRSISNGRNQLAPERGSPSTPPACDERTPPPSRALPPAHETRCRGSNFPKS